MRFCIDDATHRFSYMTMLINRKIILLGKLRQPQKLVIQCLDDILLTETQLVTPYLSVRHLRLHGKIELQKGGDFDDKHGKDKAMSQR